jgi:hypothetical protein
MRAGRRYLIQFAEDNLRKRPFVDPRERKFIGTFVPVTVPGLSTTMSATLR